MDDWRKFIFTNKSVSWLVLTAVVILSLSPSHMHLIHDDEVFASSHGIEVISHVHPHTSSVHAISDTTGHSEHEDVAVLHALSDSLVKKVNFNPMFLAILIWIFFIFGIAPASHKLRPLVSIYSHKLHICLPPPLRAPPIC